LVIESVILADLQERVGTATVTPSAESLAEGPKSTAADLLSKPPVGSIPASDYQLAKDITVAVGVFVLVVIALLALGL